MNRMTWITVWGLFFLFSSIPAVLGQASKPPQKTPELLAQGKKLFEQNCVMCHGAKGDGKGQLGAALKPSPTDFTQPLSEWPFSKGEQKKSL